MLLLLEQVQDFLRLLDMNMQEKDLIGILVILKKNMEFMICIQEVFILMIL